LKKLCFVGGMDKLDIIKYVATIIRGATMEQKSCLIVDFTEIQKTRYLIPSIEITKPEKGQKYITTEAKVDIAVGYNNYNELVQEGILDNMSDTGKKYDFVFFDVDNKEALASIPLDVEDKVFMMTTLDIYSLEKAVEAFAGYNSDREVNRVIFGKKVTAQSMNYISYLTKDLKIRYEEHIITFPYDNGDLTIIHENQRARRLNLKPFSNQFKTALSSLVEMVDNTIIREVSRYMKILEKN
jgi:hypothetical protein